MNLYTSLLAAHETLTGNMSEGPQAQAFQLIESGRINADDTIEEGNATAEDFDSLVAGSISSLLCFGEYDSTVINFFADKGIRA